MTLRLMSTSLVLIPVTLLMLLPAPVAAAGKRPAARTNTKVVGAPATRKLAVARKAPTNARLLALQQERLTVLRQIEAAVQARVARGIEGTSYHDLLKAQRDVLNAELELATGDSQRIAILEKLLSVDKRFEEIVKARIRAGDAAQADLLPVTADRLSTEIALEKVRTAMLKR